MPDTAQLSDWRKCRQESLDALPGHVVFLIALISVLLGLHYWIGLPVWIWVVAVNIGAWGLVGDCINVVYLSRRIAASEPGRRK